MNRSYLDHPSEEALERFLLRHAQGEELDMVETHILACDTCVSRLEQLEIQVAAAKLALHELSREPKRENAVERRSRTQWFTFRTLSLAGAVAALALVITMAPKFVPRTIPEADVSLSANRGSEVAVVPQGTKLHLHLSAPDIVHGPVQVAIVQGDGLEVWKGSANAQDDRVEVNVPQLAKAGTHFLRLYSVPSDHSAGELLREFSFHVK